MISITIVVIVILPDSRPAAAARSDLVMMCVYIYIYIEREMYICVYILLYIYIYIYIYIYYLCICNHICSRVPLWCVSFVGGLGQFAWGCWFDWVVFSCVVPMLCVLGLLLLLLAVLWGLFVGCYTIRSAAAVVALPPVDDSRK